MHILQNLPLLTTCIDITLAHAPIIDHPHHFSGLLTLSLFLPRPLSLFLTHNQSSVQSVQSLRHGQLCDTTGCSMPGFPVHHQLPGLAQNHVHRVGDTIQTSHPLSSLSPPAFNLSQHQGLFKCVSSSLQVAKVLELQLQHQSFQ